MHRKEWGSEVRATLSALQFGLYLAQRAVMTSHIKEHLEQSPCLTIHVAEFSLGCAVGFHGLPYSNIYFSCGDVELC